MEKIKFDHHDQPLTFNLDQTREILTDLTTVSPRQHLQSERFVLLFRGFFADGSKYTGSVANQTNWTYVTVFSIQQAAHQLNLFCDFETRGRFDAVISRPIAPPGDDSELVMFAEWEARAATVFRKGAELEKLWKGAANSPSADAFLFTYVEATRFNEFVRETVIFWQSRKSRRKRKPRLYLTIIVFNKVGNSEEFIFMRTLVINRNEVELWHDLGFAGRDAIESCFLKIAGSTKSK